MFTQEKCSLRIPTVTEQGSESTSGCSGRKRRLERKLIWLNLSWCLLLLSMMLLMAFPIAKSEVLPIIFGLVSSCILLNFFFPLSSHNGNRISLINGFSDSKVTGDFEFLNKHCPTFQFHDRYWQVS